MEPRRQSTLTANLPKTKATRKTATTTTYGTQPIQHTPNINRIHHNPKHHASASHSPTPQSSLLQEAIYGVVTGVAIAAIVSVGLYLYLGKARKPKTEVHLEIFDATGLLVSFKKRIQVKLGGHG